MPKCQECRVNEVAHYTRWERVRRWFFRHFTDDIQDLKDDCYTRGFGEGYEKGFIHRNDIEQTYANLEAEDVPEDGPTVSSKVDEGNG
jgi:hypothetical protein